MRTAMLLGSLGAVLIASPRRKRRDQTAHVDPSRDIGVPTPGTLFLPLSPMAIDDGSQYCLASMVLSICADALRHSDRISERKKSLLPKNKVFRRQFCNLLLSSPFNDTLYGENPMPGTNVARGPLGSTISIRSKHADNLSLLKEGKPLKRTIDRRGRVIDEASAHCLPMLWIPFICLESLAQGQVSTGSYEYEDGSSTIVPPPPIMGLV